MDRPSTAAVWPKRKAASAVTSRRIHHAFLPNLQEKRIWVPELKRFVKVKLTARALKTINKNGAYATLKKAGII